MKFLRLMPVVLLSLLFTSGVGYSQPPVIDESDEYSSAIHMQDIPDAYGVSKSLDADEDELSWQKEPPIEEQPLVKNKTNEEEDADSEGLTEQVHDLQAEIQDLRGQIEVQAHDLKMLQQQQVAFYKDLDTRLQKQKSAPNNDIASSNMIAPLNKITAENNKRANPADEQISYLAAYELIKTKQFDQALKAMQQFIQRYPDSGYSANAYYWIGELYLVRNDNQRALEAFNTVLNNFPKSSKAAASELKASYALVNLGQIDAARFKLNHLLNQYPDTKTARLAKQKLDSMN